METARLRVELRMDPGDTHWKSNAPIISKTLLAFIVFIALAIYLARA